MAGKYGGSWWNPIDNILATPAKIADPNYDLVPGISIGGGKGGAKSSSQSSTSRTQKAETSAQLSTGTYGGGGGSSSYDPAALFQYDQGINQYNDALVRLDNQLNTALGNIANDYNRAYNTLLGQRATARRDYQTGKDQQLQDYQDARENVATNTRNLLLNARRLLGAAGAGGGSADRFAAPFAAQQEGSANNAIVQKTNSRNLAALDTAHEDNERKFESGFSDLDYQRQSAERGTRSQFEQQRADILNNLAMLQGQRALAQGQSLAQAQAAASPYTSRVGGILAAIDRLAANPATIRQQEIALSRPDLAQYQWDRFAAPTMAQQDPSLSSAVRVLTGQSEDEQRPLV